MPPYVIRSTIYNLCFYGLTATACVLCLPTLFLPRKAFMTVVHGFVFCNHILEKYILGLDFEVRGREYLPSSGSYIVASKHQSAYETTKLHILFDDPAIILKKELLKIPLWGQYLAKSDVIAIDRSTPKSAIESIQDGARRMQAQGRPVIIFPQGTRVSVTTTAQDRPYKIGVARLQEATNLPIIPLAMNTGVFWPRNSWIKKPGTVVFEFLPPIEPGKPPAEILSKLEKDMEGRSVALMNEAQTQRTAAKGKSWLLPAILLVLAFGYIANWLIVARYVEAGVNNALTNFQRETASRFLKQAPPAISGFPGKMKLSLGPHSVLSPAGTAEFESFSAESWPLPYMPLTLEAVKISVKARFWKEGQDFDSLHAVIRPRGKIYDITESEAVSGNFKIRVAGRIDLQDDLNPGINLTLELENYQPFIAGLAEKGIIRPQAAMIASAGLKAFERGGIARVSLTKSDRAVYLGPIKIFEFPPERRRLHTQPHE
jgi:1-acyl-sn-glycerol-3-phosphate acyltransferase